MRRDDLFLTEMIEAGTRIVTLAMAIDQDAFSDRDRLDALLWNYTVLGEAAGRVSVETRAAHPAVPWSDPVRLRNRIVHGYWSVDLDVLISTAKQDIPGLIEASKVVQQGSN